MPTWRAPSKRKLPEITDWKLCRMFDRTVVQGWSSEGHKITRAVDWWAADRFGTDAGAYRVGQPAPDWAE